MEPNIRDIKITPAMLKTIAEVDKFKGEWPLKKEKILPEKLQQLKRVATIESVGSSNRIEGNRLTDGEIETLFQNIHKQSFRLRDVEEVNGYRDLVNLVFDNYEDIPLSENYIRQLHQTMLKYSGKDEFHLGEYKKHPNRVAAFAPDGREIGSIFETVSPFDTPRLMGELVKWTNDNLADGYLHPILVIGVFVVHFLAIHPFTDGNGRLSRVLTLLLMLKCGYEYMPYSSMENIIEHSKDSYNMALRRTQKNIWQGQVDYEPWLEFFVGVVGKRVKGLQEKLEGSANEGLSRLANSVMLLFAEKNNWTTTELALRLQVKRETMKKCVQGLVVRGLIKKNGVTRAAWYEKV